MISKMQKPSSNNNNYLAIDTFGKILSAAVSNDEEIHYTETASEMKQSELVMDMIDTLIKKAGITPSELDMVLCMEGPGSFTGLRIGYSIAKGLALSLSVPISAIPTLDCIAFQAAMNTENLLFTDSSHVLAVIESRKNAFYYSFFRNLPSAGFNLSRLIDDSEGDILHITGKISNYKEKITITGPGSSLLYNNLPLDIKENILINDSNSGYAKELIILAKNRKIIHNDNSNYLYSGPEYIRKTPAEEEIAQQ